MLFDVYSKFDLTPENASGCYLWDKNGTKYLDCYGGHGVISIGHNHPVWQAAIIDQISKISFYSNAVKIPCQEELADKLAKVSGYSDHNLFLVNSGAEANENALKLASFHTGRSKVIAFNGGFHGRTSGTMAISDYPKMKSPFNTPHDVQFFKLGDESVFEEIKKAQTAGVIIEGIQGIAGVEDPGVEFLLKLHDSCYESGTAFILDEVQSGFGRTGDFFAHQHAGIEADIITMAKGMGNGFPVGGLLIHPDIKAKKGLLGTTFGGSYLACKATIAVLDILEKESLCKNSKIQGEKIINQLAGLPAINKLKGRGLMIGLEFSKDSSSIRKKLLEANIITGSSSNPQILRILPPLIFGDQERHMFIENIISIVNKENEAVSVSK